MEKAIEHKMCSLILSTTVSETLLILRQIQRNIVINEHVSSCKIRIIFVLF
jgi:hypothetical protein